MRLFHFASVNLALLKLLFESTPEPFLQLDEETVIPVSSTNVAEKSGYPSAKN
jgi:hypothetical protein